MIMILQELTLIVILIVVVIIGFNIGISSEWKKEVNADQCRQINQNELHGSMPAVKAEESVYYNTIFISEKNYKQFHGDSILTGNKPFVTLLKGYDNVFNSTDVSTIITSEDEFFRPIFGNSPYPLIGIEDSIKMEVN